jgi:hypothetical protein
MKRRDGKHQDGGLDDCNNQMMPMGIRAVAGGDLFVRSERFHNGDTGLRAVANEQQFPIVDLHDDATDHGILATCHGVQFNIVKLEQICIDLVI